MPQSASRGVIWALATFALVVVIAAPGTVYALTQGQERTRGLLICVGVELVIIVCVGLYLRTRARTGT
ncbi:hypothetical protein HY68_05165 [Streptomyces sp. AcH 505]|nr:hypothetical protein HY68_05165 [Streptomyces sp. AcH 505]